jgi:hypothetical protein
MPKRTVWLATGLALGATSTLWAERRVRRGLEQAVAKLQPDAIVVGVGRSAKQAAGYAGNRVRDAMSSGRDEMLRREEELWAEFAASRVGDGGAVRAPALEVTVEPRVSYGSSPPRRPSLRLPSLAQGRFRTPRSSRSPARSRVHPGREDFTS